MCVEVFFKALLECDKLNSNHLKSIHLDSSFSAEDCGICFKLEKYLEFLVVKYFVI